MSSKADVAYHKEKYHAVRHCVVSFHQEIEADSLEEAKKKLETMPMPHPKSVNTLRKGEELRYRDFVFVEESASIDIVGKPSS